MTEPTASKLHGTSDLAMRKGFARAIAEVLGLDLNRVGDVSIDAGLNQVLTVNVSMAITYEELRIATAKMHD